MTALEIMTLGAARASFTVSSTTYKDRARQYLNDEIDELCTSADWLWRFKTSTISAVNGTSTYSLASDVMFPSEFWDETNNGQLVVRGLGYVSGIDSDQNETGTPAVIILLGLNVTTGYWTVRVHPTPDASATLGYAYWSYVPEVFAPGTGGAVITDSTEMNLYIPRYLHPALYHGIEARFYSGKGARDHAQAAMDARDRIIKKALQIQGRQITTQKSRFSRYTPRSNNLDLVITSPISP